MTDLTRQEILELQQELPEEVKTCEKSVREDNPDLSKSQAIAICRDELNIQAEDDDCPNGQVKVGDSCIDVKEVENVPPSSLDMSHHRILANRYLAGPIEREELSDNKVRYKDVALIDHGVWTDAGSGQPTEYDPQELKVVEDNALNIAHDSESNSSEAGYIEADSYYVEDGTGYANIVLNTDKSAGEYADDNLQETLESGGTVGFGGPSIEIPANAYDLEEGEMGPPKLVNGEIHGAGLVMDPASKSTSFARQTAERGVALSDGEESKSVWLKEGDMSDALDLEALREQYNLSDDVDESTIKELADAGALSLEEDEYDEEEEEDVEGEEGEYEDEEEDEDKDMQDVEELMSMVESMQERMSAIEEAHEELVGGEEMEDMEEDVENAKSELSAAKETIEELKEDKKELEEAKEDLDSRLSKLEDEPKKPKTMSDDGEDSVEFSAISPSQHRGY